MVGSGLTQSSETHYESGVYRRLFKRPFDIGLSLLALVLLCPLLFTVALLVRFKLGSPILFKQKRPGLKERTFILYKFRTMTDLRDAEGNLLPDGVRLTKFGRMLRATSLDELPELINILLGDMSIVGPRPLAMQYLPFYSPEERRRHEVRMGLSGLAQVNGRNAIGWEEKFAFDVQYVDRITFRLDLWIIIKTISQVFKRSDIGERGIDSPIDFDVHRQAQIRNEQNLGKKRVSQ